MTRVEGTERNWGESLQTGCRSRSIRADLLGQHARRKPERDGGTRARREGGRVKIYVHTARQKRN